MPLLTNQWNTSNYKDTNRQRIYLKDIDCPHLWHDKLQELIPLGLFYLNESTGDLGGIGAGDEPDPQRTGMRKGRGIAKAGDLMSSLPPEMRAENMMCYIGHEGTYTPAHREMCASLGQNIMVETSTGAVEDGKPTKPGSSIWFMTESKEREVVSEYWLSTLGHDIEVENHFAQINAWKAAPFKTYVVEQRLGDFILIPPLAPHQVWNRGTRTMKVAWNRTTVETLEMALNEALPNARMVCRDEQYKNKAIIYFTLIKYSRLLKAAEKHKQKKSGSKHKDSMYAKLRQLEKDFKRLQALFTQVLVSESFFPDRQEKKVDLVPYDSYITCSYCRCNIFNRFLTCPFCVGELPDGEQDTYDLCMDCYVMGRSCACISRLKWVEQFPWGELTQKHEHWRHQIIQFEGSVTEKSPRALETELERLGKKRTLAQICQLELRKRPWRDIMKPLSPVEGVVREEEIDVDANGNLKKKRKIHRSEKFIREHKACHVDKHWEPKWKQAECNNCGESFCYGTLFRGYDMMLQDIMADPDWKCPKCLNICGCRDCRKKPGNRAYTPNGTRLGHNTKAFADPRSVESLVDFSYSNLSWIQKTGDDTPRDTRRLKKRIRAADKAKEQGAALGEDYVEHNAMTNGDNDGVEDSMLKLTQQGGIPIDPSLSGLNGDQADPISSDASSQYNENPEEFAGFRHASMQIPIVPQFVVPAGGVIRNTEHAYDTTEKITYDYPDPETGEQALPLENLEKGGAALPGYESVVPLLSSHIEMVNRKRKRANVDEGDRPYSYKKGTAEIKTKRRRSFRVKLSVDETKLGETNRTVSAAQRALNGLKGEDALVISSDLRALNAEWNSTEGQALRKKANVEEEIVEEDGDEFIVGRRRDRGKFGMNELTLNTKLPQRVTRVKAVTHEEPSDKGGFNKTLDEKSEPRPQDKNAKLRIFPPDSQDDILLSNEDSRPSSRDGPNGVQKRMTASNDHIMDVDSEQGLKRRASSGLFIRPFAEFNQENSMDEHGSYSEESGIDIQQALSQKSGRVNVNAPPVRVVQNNPVSNAAQSKAAQTNLAAKIAKEDRAKAIAAAEANRKAQLAAVERMNQDDGSVASEAWSGSEGESVAPTPRKNGSTQNKPGQQPQPIARESHSISKGPVKVVPVQTASAADWSESSSDDEPPPKATGHTPSSRGHSFVSINDSSGKSGYKRR
jgi:JmjC domain, hydroxylase/Zinc-finger domain of monoamine-oxidase A repressor R1